jgi:hypothetical protein
MKKKFTLKDIRLSDVNRDINLNHVERLKEILIKHGYFEGSPIIVDEDGLIIDGQHRYVACKELKIEPTIVQAGDFDMVPILNSTQLSWSMKDYVKYYAAKAYEDYVILEQLCKAKNISPNVAYIIIMGRGNERSGMANSLSRTSINKHPVRQGTFKIPDKSQKGLDKLERKVDAILNLVARLDLPRTERLVLAITRLAEDKNFSFKVMEAKIAYQRARIYRCSTINEYMQMLANIYNHKNTKKVAV